KLKAWHKLKSEVESIGESFTESFRQSCPEPFAKSPNESLSKEPGNNSPNQDQEQEQDNKPPGPRADGITIPRGLDTPEFRAAWHEWQNHHREIRKPLKPTTITKQLKKLADWGPARAVSAIEHSITNGWAGLFEPDPPQAATGAIPNSVS